MSKDDPNLELIDIAVSAAARNKSYTGIAIFVFFLYFIFYFPGLAANSFFYQEAKKMEEKAGTKLPGVNLLAGMMWINAVVIIGTILVLCFLFGVVLFS